MNNYCVYKHTAPNGKVYIGITEQAPGRRWRPDGSGYRQNEHFFNAIKKYGWDNIKHEILYEDLTKEEACEIEQELIAEYKSNKIKYGYNQSSGGEHFEHGEETREKLRNATSELWEDPKYREHMSRVHKGKGISGWHHTDEARENMRKAANERYKDKDLRKRIAESAKKRHKNDPEHLSRISKESWSDPEYREMMRKKHKGNHNRAKKVICVETGEVFESTLAAAKAMGVARETIGQVCRGLREMTCGYHWRFYDDQSNQG